MSINRIFLFSRAIVIMALVSETHSRKRKNSRPANGMASVYLRKKRSGATGALAPLVTASRPGPFRRKTRRNDCAGTSRIRYLHSTAVTMGWATASRAC